MDAQDVTSNSLPAPPRSCRAAVMTAPRRPLELLEYPVPPVGRNELLVRIQCTTLCGSDLHTWEGRRTSPTPIILGHEAVGVVEQLGVGRDFDSAGLPLRVGDRVTWTLFSHCGECDFCRRYDLSMKCRKLRKFGHDACDRPPHLFGGLAERCLLDAGVCVFRVPDTLSDLAATPANCAVATALAVCDAARIARCDSVWIQGAGALGVYAAAFALESGCKSVLVSDRAVERLETASRFVATAQVQADERSDEEAAADALRAVKVEGFDAVLGLSGSAAAVGAGVAALRPGGAFVEAGCVYPGASTMLDLSRVVSRRLTIRGVHNYHVRHLAEALRFLADTNPRYDWGRVVAKTYPLASADEAIAEAATNRHALRIGVHPTPSP